MVRKLGDTLGDMNARHLRESKKWRPRILQSLSKIQRPRRLSLPRQTGAEAERLGDNLRDVEAGTVFNTLADLLSKAEVGQLATHCAMSSPRQWYRS